MNLFSDRFVARFAELLTTALIHFVWQGAVLTLMLLIIVKMLDVRSAPLRYPLSVGTLLLMGMAPILTIALHQNGKVARRQSVEVSDHANMVFASRGLNADVQGALATHWNPGIEVAVLIAWLAGVSLLSIRLAIGFGITVWIRAKLEPLSEPFELRVRILGDRLSMNARQRVFASVRVGQAVAIGFIRPVVLIPVAWLTQLTPEMLEAVIAHELAHIRRWDLWVNLVQRVIETLLFYHPAVWWLSSRIRLEREMCCDEIAAGCLDRAVYVRSLESVARIAHGNLLMATSIQGGMKMKLLKRIRYLLGVAPVEATGNWWAVGFTTIILPFAAAVAFSLASGSTPSVATADDSIPVVVKPADQVVINPQPEDKSVRHTEFRGIQYTVTKLVPIAVVKSNEKGLPKPVENPSTKITVGDLVEIRMSGELAKEYHRRSAFSGPNEIIPDGLNIGTMANVEQILEDGRYRIGHTSKFMDDKNRPRLLTLTAIVDSKKIKTEIIPKGTETYASPAVKNNGVKSVLTEEDQFRQVLELSDLKDIKLQSWELREEIGK